MTINYKKWEEKVEKTKRQVERNVKENEKNQKEIENKIGKKLAFVTKERK